MEGRLLLAVFTVTTTADAGPGSLRQAILDANAASSADEIRFNVAGEPGTGVRTIRPQSPLPAATGAALTVDATTQPGYDNAPVVELDGSNAGAAADGLVLGINGVVRGLVINRFGRNGIVLNGAGGTVQGNYVGTNATGSAALPNGGAGLRAVAPVVIGGLGVGQRNVISGNAGPGVWITGSSAGAVATIQGNYVGTDAAGSAAVGNGREGVLLEAAGTGSGPTVQLGGTFAGSSNVISGNGGSGVRVGPRVALTIQGNMIGTDRFGTRAVPNGTSPLLPYRDGITAVGASGLMVGGATAGARNVISGNHGAGVSLINSGAGNTGLRVQGNFIGTDADGAVAVGNGGDGVSFVLTSGVSDLPTVQISGNLVSGNGGNGIRTLNASPRIGGNYVGTNAAGTGALGNAGDGVQVTNGSVVIGRNIPIRGLFGIADAVAPAAVDPAAVDRNVISANGGNGIHVIAGTATVSDNYVGTTAAGTAPLGNGGNGVFLDAAASFAVGGLIGTGSTAPPVANVISANRGNGILIVSGATSLFGATRTVRGNKIGTDANGDPANTALGNAGHGVAVYSAGGVSVGRIEDTTGNTIAFNGGSGVYVEGPHPRSTNEPTSVTIVRNSIFSNARLGIDLAGNDAASGVTLNDPGDADTGPNALLNYPVITSAAASATATTVRVRLDASPAIAYRVDFYSSPEPDPTGFGEGRTYLGSATVTAGATAATVTLPATPVGAYVTATATGSATSEFSPAVRVNEAGTPAVVGRFTFYNNSAFDGRDFHPTAADDAAIATDKVALLPGQAGSFNNVTGYSRGLNGIIVDIANAGAPERLLIGDFTFRTGSGGDPAGWVTFGAPSNILVRPGEGTGGSDRVMFTWSDGVSRNRWVQVTTKANANTGLSRPDVFYFGNLVGETGDAPTPLRVSALDLAAVRRALGAAPPRVTNPYDINRDGAVNGLDVAAVRGNEGRALQPPFVPIPVALAPVSVNDPADRDPEGVQALLAGV